MEKTQELRLLILLNGNVVVVYAGVASRCLATEWQDNVGMNHGVCAHQLCRCLLIAVKKRLWMNIAVLYIHT